MKRFDHRSNYSMGRTDLSHDQVFELLDSVRRRYAIHYLRRENHTVDLSDLTDHVAAWEFGTTSAELMSKQRKRVYISLYQTHLPVLDEMGIIEYDRDSGEIRPTNRIRNFDIYLRAHPTPAHRWIRYYQWLAVGSIAFLGSIWMGLYPLSVLPWSVAVLCVVIAFGTIAMFHYRHARKLVPETPPEAR